MLTPTILDDFHLHRHHPFLENIDYTDNCFTPCRQLHACWKENSSLRATHSHTELDARRLENISWRKWNKQLWDLQEIPPSEINWNKNQDITWLYGPKYLAITYQREDDLVSDYDMPKNEYKNEYKNDRLSLTQVNLDSFALGVPDLETDDNSSVLSESSDKSAAVDPHVNDGYYHLKPALKEVCHPFRHEKSEKKRRKSVKFNYIVNSREIVNGYKFDYDILDASCL